MVFLGSTLFRYLIFPLGSAALGIFVNVATRSDRYRVFQKEDLAVGLQLISTAGMMFLVLCSDRALAFIRVNAAMENALSDSGRLSQLQLQAATLSKNLGESGWLIAMMFLGLFGASTLVRLFGWKSETELNFVGITFPLAIGMVALLVVMASASQ